ncbi:MAG: hypothetical protein ACOZCK_13690 [Pseudomonadota bacterium]
MGIKPISNGNMFAIVALTNLAARLGLQSQPAAPVAGDKGDSQNPAQAPSPVVNGQGQVTGRIIDTQA